MSKNVQLIILHIAVAVLCFIGALVFFNNRMGMEKGSAVAELIHPILFLRLEMIRAAII